MFKNIQWYCLGRYQGLNSEGTLKCHCRVNGEVIILLKTLMIGTSTQNKD